MSENRGKYSSAPLQNMRRQPHKTNRNQNAPRKVSDFSQQPAGSRSFVLLQVLLMFVLPLLFVVSLILADNTLYLAFAGLSALSVLAMWLLNAFVRNARSTFTVLHAGMIVVALFAVLISSPQPAKDQTSKTAESQASAWREPSNAMMGLAASQEPQVTATPNPGAASFAEQRLKEFMSAWHDVDYDAMVNLSTPSWVQKQDDAKRRLFAIRANRVPESYIVKDVSGNDGDSARNIALEVKISRSSSEAAKLYAMEVLMVRVNDVWYVDPDSLASTEITASAGSLPTPNLYAATPTPKADPNTVLYYNPKGGEFYHIDPNCASLGDKFKPLTSFFYYREASDAKYKVLRPCPVCKAPAR